jgi:hypothetical protein
MDEFHNIPLSFEHKGHIISGILNGNLINWEFRSNDILLKKYFKEGILKREISFTNYHLDFDSFMDSFYKQADSLIKKVE